jgi:WD40 repeat protein
MTEEQYLMLHDRIINKIKISPNEQFIVTICYSNYIKIWNAYTYEEIRTISYLESGYFIDFSIHPNNINLITIYTDDDEDFDGNYNGDIILWNILTGERIFRIVNLTSLHNVNYNSNGDQIIVSIQNEIQILNSFDGSILKQFMIEPINDPLNILNNSVKIYNGQFNSNGKIIACSKLDKSVARGDNRKWSILVYDNESNTRINEFIGHNGGIQCIVFTHDDKIIISSAPDNTIRLWNIETGTQIGIINTSKIHSMKIDNNNIICGINSWIQIWNIHTLELIHTIDRSIINGGGIISIEYNNNRKSLLISDDCHESVEEYDISSLIKIPDVLFVDLPIEII